MKHCHCNRSSILFATDTTLYSTSLSDEVSSSKTNVANCATPSSPDPKTADQGGLTFLRRGRLNRGQSAVHFFAACGSAASMALQMVFGETCHLHKVLGLHFGITSVFCRPGSCQTEGNTHVLTLSLHASNRKTGHIQTCNLHEVLGLRFGMTG